MKKKKKFRIHPLLLPLKYKIVTKGNIFNIFRKLSNKAYLQKFIQKGDYDYLLNKLNSNNLNKSDEQKIYAITYYYLLIKLKENKKNILKNKYNDEVIINANWIDLKKALKSPVYFFQDIYFNYIHLKLIVDIFGEVIAGIIEEILRDDIITKNEREYIIEKAEQYGIDSDKMTGLLEKYFEFNPAIKRILYEICKDGIMTNAEKDYLIEKANQYNISKEKIINEIDSIINTINKIHELIKNENNYNAIIIIFLLKFIEPTNDETINSILEKFHLMINGTGEKIGPNYNNRIMDYIISSFNEVLKFKIFRKDITSLDNIINNLGLVKIDHQIIVEKYCVNTCEVFSTDKLIIALRDFEKKGPDVVMDENRFNIGREVYEFNYIKTENHPLFSFDIIGQRTIITVNQKHYFYNGNRYFKLGILSAVINLKKNYASEDLVDEIQFILNPPAQIRINFPRN